METNEMHDNLIKGISKQQKLIFETSGQGIYIYLDDNHVIFNQKFASILGYSSVNELELFKGAFLTSFVTNKSHNTLVDAYQRAINQMEGSTIEIFWKKKNGGEIRTSVMLVPLVFEGHLFAMHFISN
jgi:PAS domain S-box-containing protein